MTQSKTAGFSRPCEWYDRKIWVHVQSLIDLGGCASWNLEGGMLGAKMSALGQAQHLLKGFNREVHLCSNVDQKIRPGRQKSLTSDDRKSFPTLELVLKGLCLWGQSLAH